MRHHAGIGRRNARSHLLRPIRENDHDNPKTAKRKQTILIPITITEKAYAALCASVDEKPKPQANPSGDVCGLLDQATVSRLVEIAKIYDGDLSKTILRLAELLDEGVSMLQEFMSDGDNFYSPSEWKGKVRAAEGREHDFRAFIKHCLSTAPRRYKEWGLDPTLDLEVVVDQALVRPGRAYLERLRQKSESIRKGEIRPKRRSFK